MSTSIIVIFTIVCLWLIFVKAGVEGWKAIIPFYNIYTECKISQRIDLWKPILIYSIISIVGGGLGSLLLTLSIIISFASDGFIVPFLMILGIIILIATAVFLILCIINSIKLTIAFGRAFGQSDGFIVGMVLLPTIFNAILAFNKDITYKMVDTVHMENTQGSVTPPVRETVEYNTAEPTTEEASMDAEKIER